MGVVVPRRALVGAAATHTNTMRVMVIVMTLMLLLAAAAAPPLAARLERHLCSQRSCPRGSERGCWCGRSRGSQHGRQRGRPRGCLCGRCAAAGGAGMAAGRLPARSPVRLPARQLARRGCGCQWGALAWLLAGPRAGLLACREFGTNRAAHELAVWLLARLRAWLRLTASVAATRPRRGCWCGCQCGCWRGVPCGCGRGTSMAPVRRATRLRAWVLVWLLV